MEIPSWLGKIVGYAPDIALAIATGGTSAIATTALRIAAKELTGSEDSGLDEVKQAAADVTSEQLENLKRMNQDFVIKRMEIEAAEMANVRSMYSSGMHDQADKIASKITVWNVPYVLGLVVINCLVVYFFREDAALVAIASNVIGIVIKSLLDQMQSVTGFYFGSSIGSKVKDK